MLNLNRKSTIFLSFTGALLSLAALLIFIFLPTSDFANSIDHSAKEALMVFITSPVFALLGTAGLLYAFLKDFKAWVDFLKFKALIISIAGVFGAFGVFNFGLFTAYLADMFSLGFIAPYSGTAYELLAVVAVISVILQFIFAGLVSIAEIRNK